MQKQNSEIIMEVVTDSSELAQARSQRKRFDRNAAWLQSHAAEVYSSYRGKCICIAGEELFVADTAKDALALATAAHPEDEMGALSITYRGKSWREFMRINGEWYLCDDGVARPVIRGEVLNVNGFWEPVLFLVDTGADRTVLSAAILDVLGFQPTEKAKILVVSVALQNRSLLRHKFVLTVTTGTKCCFGVNTLLSPISKRKTSACWVVTSWNSLL